MKKFLLFLWVLFVLLHSIIADEISVEAKVNTREVFLGDSLIFSIVVQGVQSPNEPNLTSIKDFSIETLTPKTSNSTSISIINGTVTKFVEYIYTFQYRLTPQKTGVLTIPPLSLEINNISFSTKSIPILVKEPEKNEDFKLEISMDKFEYYVGEPMEVKVTWFITKTVQDASFIVPLFEDPRFQDTEQKKIDPSTLLLGTKHFDIPVNNTKEIATREKSTWKGKMCQTISFSHILIPKEAGDMDISPAVVSFSTLIAVPRTQQHRHSQSFFDDFDDDFFGHSFFNTRRQYTTLKKYSVPSEPIKFKIKQVPSKGKPANFSGNIGEYTITTSAKPLEVNVGTPITLTIEIKGSIYPNIISMPNLSILDSDFKVPKQNSAGKVENGAKIFTQTIRPNNDQITKIPAIPFSYFDDKKEKYVTVKSAPIDITVHPTKVITANDIQNTTIIVEKNELEDFNEGIAFNYEGLDVLENQNYDLRTLKKFPWFIIIIFLPCSYIICIIMLLIKRKQQHNNKQKNAYRIFCKQWEKTPQTAGNQLILLREYFGNKLNLSNGSLTWNEIAEYLPNSSIKDRLHQIFDSLEASYYTGTNETLDPQLAINVKETIDALQLCLNV